MKDLVKQATKAFVAAAIAVLSSLGAVLVGNAGLGSVTTAQWLAASTAGLTAFIAVYHVSNTSPSPPPDTVPGG
jgi:hypothetical protein